MQTVPCVTFQRRGRDGEHGTAGTGQAVPAGLSPGQAADGASPASADDRQVTGPVSNIHQNAARFAADDQGLSADMRGHAAEGVCQGIPQGFSGSAFLLCPHEIHPRCNLHAFGVRTAWRRPVGHAARRANPESVIYIRTLGGAISRVADDDSAYPHRPAGFNVSVDAVWHDPGLDEAAPAGRTRHGTR